MALPAPGKQVWSGKLWMSGLFVLFFLSFIRCDYWEGKIRLMVDRDKSSGVEGRVEIFHDGQWGTICDSGWDDLDAEVVCRQLGYSGGVGVARSGGSFGLGSGPIHLENVDCWGQETMLILCNRAGWGNHYCRHPEDAGVYCGDIIEGTIQLMVDGHISDDDEGRVEIFHGGQWGRVCDSGWDDLDAKVVCRQLGYSGNVGVARSGGSFGQGSGPEHLDFVGCRGYESKLTLCNLSKWGRTSCGYESDAGVYCGDIIEGTIQLMVDGHISDDDEGRVEIFLQGQWGTVCDDDWDDLDAQVVCRQLEYSGNVGLARSGAFYGRGSGPVHLDDVGCSGSESRLTDCSNPGWGKTNCGHGQDAGVYCGAGKNPSDRSRGGQRRGPMDKIEGKIRLVVDGNISDDEGRVEIFHEGQWGTVCDDGWDDSDARVVCRQRGYSHNGGLARSGGSFGRGSGPVHLGDVGCSGSESRLTDCSNPGWGKTNCGHGQDAGVYCGAGKNPAGGSGGGQRGDPMEPQTHPTMETSSRAASVMESVGMCFSLLTMLAIIAVC